jgi:hypothetical protein
MVAGQDWCLQCGAGAPGSLGTGSWRSTATVLAAVAVLALGAAVAAYAALSKGTAKARVLTTTVAQTTAPSAGTPAGTPAATTPGVPAAKTRKAKASLGGLGAVKPPKIPLSAVTPKASEKTSTTPSSKTNTSTSTSTTPSSSSTGGSGATGEESKQTAILLDTDAASTYNPYAYPASWFGEPSLTIDGDTATAWTAQVNPATAPKMAEGLLIDLKSKQKLSALELVTSTPGMTVQVYGANGHTAPASITDPAWVPISRPEVVKKKHLRIALGSPIAGQAKKAFTFVTLWISRAGESSVGTATAPGHVSVNEVELFPAS